MITDFHAKYYAHELSIQHSTDGVDRLSQSLFDASVDLNPHQIDAALFALNNPLSLGVVLADEVGLGKTIEAGLVLCQLWAERKRQLLIICPASLRQQWAQELKDKFNLPVQILDSRTWRKLQKEGIYNPLNEKKIIIMSFHYAARLEDKLVAEPWSLVVIDEAHKLRNAYRPSNKMGQSLRRALNGRNKLLLTATPLQNSLLELYGLSTLIDEHLFGDPKSFRKQYINNDATSSDLKDRLSGFVKRTLRKDVLEYVRYTDRKTTTIPFTPSDSEQVLYDGVSALLGKEESYALPKQQRHLTGLILRKLLASSSYAVLNTLKAIKKRLEKLRDENVDESLFIGFLADDDLDSEYLDEMLDGPTENKQSEDSKEIDTDLINTEIVEIEQLIYQAKNITADSKLKALKLALKAGFSQMIEMGAAEKAIIFTESRRTQEYIAKYLQANGYDGQFVLFSGSNNSPETTQIYQQWLKDNENSDKITGSPQIDRRSALIDYFKHHAKIMIATEAAAEGVNLQFCSLVINYDLPWNPQRIEQRIGRCHRYGQKFDVVVINFLNERNYADQRVLELLTEKFNLFDGVFGASDEVLGQIESGLDFEQRIKDIYDSCRKADEIEQAFNLLQKELESDIKNRLRETQKVLLENFDEEIHDLLKIRLDEAEQRLDKISRWFWLLTQHQLSGLADFDDQEHSFHLKVPVIQDSPVGTYQLIRANGDKQDVSRHSHTYRLTHPLGEFVLEKGCKLDTPLSKVIFDYSIHDTKIAIAEQLQGQSGWLTLKLLTIESLQKEQYLIFTGITDANKLLDDETCRKLFNVGGDATITDRLPDDSLNITSQRQVEAKLSEAMEANNQFFQNEREKLEKWADDKVLAAEQDLQDTKAKLRAIKRESRLAQSMEEQQTAQKQLRELERLQRRQRQQIFDVEDEIIEKRDELIELLEQRLQQRTDIKELFTINWQVQ